MGPFCSFRGGFPGKQKSGPLAHRETRVLRAGHSVTGQPSRVVTPPTDASSVATKTWRIAGRQAGPGFSGWPGGGAPRRKLSMLLLVMGPTIAMGGTARAVWEGLVGPLPTGRGRVDPQGSISGQVRLRHTPSPGRRGDTPLPPEHWRGPGDRF